MTTGKKIGPIPQTGFGTWDLRGDACTRCVTQALETGYRHIDTAEGYQNEESVGAALAASGLKRDDFFLTTKVAPASFGPGMMLPAVRRSLDKLQVDQVDLLLLHWPSIREEYAMEDYFAQFAAVHDMGLTRHIGVSNFTKAYLDRALALLGTRKLATHQCELHVFHQNCTIAGYSAAKGIPMTAYCPLAQGLVKDDPLLAEIGRAHAATAAQIALAFLLHEGRVVIPSSSKPARMAENFAAAKISLSATEMQRLHGLERGQRLINPSWAPIWDD